MTTMIPNNDEKLSRVEQLIQQVGEDLKQGLLPLKVYNDAELHELEMKRIFARSWMFVGHESEIPSPGDYAVRYIGEDPFIFVRDENGIIRVIFDSCSHHGTTVCRAEVGNASHFRCPYHGWTFKNTGELIGVPQKNTAYKNLNQSEWGLTQAPRVDIYEGLVFASLESTGPSLEEHLGEYKWYLDLHLKFTGGMEVVGEPHRWVVNADWKSGADNFSGDSYHTQSAHRSILELGLADMRGIRAGGVAGDIHITECSGHSSSIRRASTDESCYWGYPPEVVETFRPDLVSKEQADLAKSCIVTTGNVFPNMSLIHISGTDDTSKPFAGFFSIRQWQSKGPGKMEVWSWTMVPKGSPEWYKERAAIASMSTFSPSGNFEQDDLTVWTSVARASKGVFAEKNNIKLNYQMGFESMSAARVMSDWPGPGITYDSNLEEGVNRTFYNSWQREMSKA